MYHKIIIPILNTESVTCISKPFLRIFSLFILVYISSLSAVNAQQYYSSLSPNAKFSEREDIKIDINNDGILDFLLHLKMSVRVDGPTNSEVHTYYFQIQASKNSEVAVHNDSASIFLFNDTINDEVLWSSKNTINIQYITNSREFSVGQWSHNREGFLGLRKLIGDEYHYAWIRLHYNLLHSMWAVDMAYQEEATEAIIAGEGLPSGATAIVGEDRHNFSDGRDIQVSFTKAFNEYQFSEYRVIVAKANDSTANDLDIMATLSEDKYYRIPVNTNWTSFTNSFFLNGSSVDKNGESIIANTAYKIHVLNISKPGSAFMSTLSNPSPKFYLRSYISPVNKPSIQDNGNYNSARDIKISFSTDSIQTSISEYRVFISPATDMDSFNIEKALSLSSEFYTSFSSNGTLISFDLQNDQLDINGNPIIEGLFYHAFVLSVSNNPSEYYSTLSSASRRFILSNPNYFTAGQKGANILSYEYDESFCRWPYWNVSFYGSQSVARSTIDVNRDGLMDYTIYGGAHSKLFLIPKRNNEVLVCEHSNHDSWIDIIDEYEAIGPSYHWSSDKSILIDQAVYYIPDFYLGHLPYDYRNYKDYYIAFKLMDGEQAQYAWLKMRGTQFLEYGFQDLSSGTNELNKQKFFNIYPNPANSYIQIQASSLLSNSQNISISIINSLGITVEEFDLNERSATKDIRHYPSGLYFFVIKDDNGVLETHRVIIE